MAIFSMLPLKLYIQLMILFLLLIGKGKSSENKP